MRWRGAFKWHPCILENPTGLSQHRGHHIDQKTSSRQNNKNTYEIESNNKLSSIQSIFFIWKQAGLQEKCIFYSKSYSLKLATINCPGCTVDCYSLKMQENSIRTKHPGSREEGQEKSCAPQCFWGLGFFPGRINSKRALVVSQHSLIQKRKRYITLTCFEIDAGKLEGVFLATNFWSFAEEILFLFLGQQEPSALHVLWFSENHPTKRQTIRKTGVLRTLAHWHSISIPLQQWEMFCFSQSKTQVLNY